MVGVWESRVEKAGVIEKGGLHSERVCGRVESKQGEGLLKLRRKSIERGPGSVEEGNQAGERASESMGERSSQGEG